MKHLPGNFFNNVAAYEYSEYFCVLPPHVTVADLFNPIAWSHHANKLQPNDLVRVRSNDGSVDITLVVDAVTVGGVHVSHWPKFRGASGDAAVEALAEVAKESTLSVVPLDATGKPRVYVEYLPATQWRVVGLNGEVARDFKTEAEANAKLAEYLKLAGLTMPEMSSEKNAVPHSEPEPAETGEQAKPARKTKAKETA